MKNIINFIKNGAVIAGNFSYTLAYVTVSTLGDYITGRAVGFEGEKGMSNCAPVEKPRQSGRITHAALELNPKFLTQ